MHTVSVKIFVLHKEFAVAKITIPIQTGSNNLARTHTCGQIPRAKPIWITSVTLMMPVSILLSRFETKSRRNTETYRTFATPAELCSLEVSG
jgi:hypothetical protein